MAKRPAKEQSPEIESQNEVIRKDAEARGGIAANTMAIVPNPLHKRAADAITKAAYVLALAERADELDTAEWVAWGLPEALASLRKRTLRVEQRLGTPTAVTLSRDAGTRLCEYCHKPLHTVRSDAKYHPACRSAAYRERRDGKV